MLADAAADDGSGGLVGARAALWMDWSRRQAEASGNTVGCCRYGQSCRRIGRLEGFGMQMQQTEARGIWGEGCGYVSSEYRMASAPDKTRRGQGRQARVALTASAQVDGQSRRGKERCAAARPHEPRVCRTLPAASAAPPGARFESLCLTADTGRTRACQRQGARSFIDVGRAMQA